VPSVPSPDRIEEAARLYNTPTRADYDVNTRRPPVAPIIAAVLGLTLAAVAVAVWSLYLVGVHL
jgi:hypothetical protein